MAAPSLLGMYTTGGRGSRRKVNARSGGRPPAAAAVRRLLSRLVRSTWRRRAARPRRAAVGFGYDLHSYSQNFDDGDLAAGSSVHRRL